MRLFCVVILLGFSFSLNAQKQLVIIKNGRVRASFKEGEYLYFVLKKNHRHAEGHIIELNDFSMITSNDTVQFKDILKIDIRKHRRSAQWGSGIGGFLFLGGLFYLGIDQLNVALGKNPPDTKNSQWAVPLGISAVGAALVFIRPRYKHLNGIQYLMTVDYNSPFYQRQR